MIVFYVVFFSITFVIVTPFLAASLVETVQVCLPSLSTVQLLHCPPSMRPIMNCTLLSVCLVFANYNYRSSLLC